MIVAVASARSLCRDGLAGGPGVPGVESVEEALVGLELLAVEVVEGGGRAVLVGGFSEVAGLAAGAWLSRLLHRDG